MWTGVASAATAGYADLVDRVAPAVVNIFTTQPAPSAQASPFGSSPFGPGGPFEDFARPFGIPIPGTPQGGAPPRPVHARGSGFVIAADGYVVTNNPVFTSSEQRSTGN